MKSPLHQLSIISRFGEVEMCPQEKAGPVWGCWSVCGEGTKANLHLQVCMGGGGWRYRRPSRAILQLWASLLPSGWLFPAWPQLRPQSKASITTKFLPVLAL